MPPVRCAARTSTSNQLSTQQRDQLAIVDSARRIEITLHAAAEISPPSSTLHVASKIRPAHPIGVCSSSSALHLNFSWCIESFVDRSPRRAASITRLAYKSTIMSEKWVAVVHIKARFLKDHINQMRAMLAEEVIDKPNLLLRLADLGTAFRKYEEAYENLAIVDKANVNVTEWSEIRELYYVIASEVGNLKTVESSASNQTIPSGTPAANSIFLEKQKLLRLPIAELPKFDGNHNDWLSYNNAFVSMVDARSDIDDSVKFLYLRNSLRGDALRKITIFDIRPENYANAWRTLQTNYERKRILVSKHVDAILGIQPAKGATTKELSNLVDEIKQHMSMLESLKVKIDCRIVIRLVEKALPATVRKKWEESLDLDELPSLEKLFTFINETTFRFCTLEADSIRDGETANNKQTIGITHASKFKKRNDGARALVTSIDVQCPQCKGLHPLYRCEDFKGLSVGDRWNVAKNHKLCFNCLRQHKGKCGMGHCKACEKFHIRCYIPSRVQHLQVC